MVSLEALQATPKPLEPTLISSPARISFSSDFLDENNFISICPNPKSDRDQHRAPRNPDFEFLSGLSSSSSSSDLITADELFSEGKLLPFWQMHHIEKLNKITLKTDNDKDEKARPEEIETNNNNKVSWFLDDDPSPRPPKCTVLWKELLRLRKQRVSSTLSPSSSSSSSRSSIGENVTSGDDVSKDKAVKRMKKGLERTRSGNSIRIRPVINVPICTHQVKSSSLPPLFPMRNKGR